MENGDRQTATIDLKKVRTEGCMQSDPNYFAHIKACAWNTLADDTGFPLGVIKHDHAGNLANFNIETFLMLILEKSCDK